MSAAAISDAALSSGLAPQTTAYDVQQACATSLETAILVGNKIAMGQIEAGIAGGVDSASDAPIAISERLRRLVLGLNRAKSASARLALLAQLRPSMLLPSVPNVNERRTGLSMGEHCEQMVRRWNIGRQAQDELALSSHTKGVAAFDGGFYKDLVILFAGLTRDNNLRADTSLAKLAKLPPVFDRSSGHGTLTAGNSTPLTDGAAAILLASEKWAGAHGQAPQAWLVDAETAAVDYFGPDPEGLLMAPVYAVPRLLDRNGLTLQDFDFYEIHEAFSGQVLCTLAAWEDEGYCRGALGRSAALGAIDRSRLNVNGGSVGLGHPFAATGARKAQGERRTIGDPQGVAGLECRAVGRERTPCDVHVNAPSRRHLEIRSLIAGEQTRIHPRVLMDEQGPVRAIRRNDEPQASTLLHRCKTLLLVARFDIALGRLDPYLQKVYGLARAWIEFAMPHAGTGAHSLHIAGFDGRSVAHRILVRQFTVQHIADDFHVAMTVRAEARSGLHAVLVDHPQGTEFHVFWIEVIGK